MHKTFIKLAGTKSGVIVLLLTILMSAIIIIITLGLSLFSSRTNQIALHQGAGTVIFGNLDGCAEEALTKLNINNAYQGETLSIGNTNCTIIVTGTDPNRTITVTGITPDYARVLQITTTIFPSFTINSWKELNT